MKSFDEYVTEMEARRAREKANFWNAELARRLKENTRQDAWRALYSALIFTGTVSDIVPVYAETGV